MTYAIKFYKKTNPDKEHVKSEVWAYIKNTLTNESSEEKIWWEDENGILHDCTPNLPTNLRRDIDTAWIENKGRL